MSYLEDLKGASSFGLTENGAVTYTSTLNSNLDLFSQAGAMRDRLQDTRSMFRMAYHEDKEIALRNLMYLRDVRGGLGEREVFRRMFSELIHEHPETARDLLIHIPEIGRWDDLVEAYYYARQRNIDIIHKEAIEIIKTRLTKDIDKALVGEEISLMAKWLPSPSVSNERRKDQANLIAKDLGLRVGDFRKILSALRKHIGIVETPLTERDYDSIHFEKLPSRALFKYRNAFARNMPEKYEEFIERVNDGEVKMNASNVLPYEIIREYHNGDVGLVDLFWGRDSEREIDQSLEATWKSLDDTIGDLEENVIVVADTSGSMIGDPWYVAESLAIYCAERLEGTFKNHFITFSDQPRLVELPEGTSLLAKMDEYERHSEVANTDIEATFQLLLDTAVKNDTPQDELPSKIIIISDMEFDRMSYNSDATAFENAKMMFELHGYELPEVVFWNVDSRADNMPVRHNEQGVALVSGLTPNIFKSVLQEDLTNPEVVMKNTLMVERYDFVSEILDI